jgi:hypothetical protein
MMLAPAIDGKAGGAKAADNSGILRRMHGCPGENAMKPASRRFDVAPGTS